MDEVHLGRRTVVPSGELDFRVARSGGPGGQGVNTTDSKVELRWDVDATDVLSDKQKRLLRKRLGNRITKDGVLILQSSEHRSQHKNREAVVARFQALVGEAITPPKRRKATRPSRAAKRRRLRDKRHRSEIKRLRKSPKRPE